MSNSEKRWTHPSVCPIAEKADPLQFIADAARCLVFRALESGWQGPPFDPFSLADFAGIKVIAREDIKEARTVPGPSGRPVIEFNPNRPRHRIKYSICHEIAHTFFPDCLERVRNRVMHEEMEADDWQLEMLCNIGAAELLMPIGSFPALEAPKVSIDQILVLHKQYEASVEAVLLRAINLASEPCFAFSASLQGDTRDRRYCVDYVRASRFWDVRIPSGLRLRRNTVAAQCTAIGFTAKGREQWTRTGETLIVECVGLPPYPNQSVPRVAGIAMPEGRQNVETKGIVFLKGDATAPRSQGPKVIAQIVNDKALTWGAGFALAVRKKWPRVQEQYRKWAFGARANLKLGNIHLAEIEPDSWLVSLVAQHGYGPSPKPRIRYAALEQALSSLSQIAKQRNATVHMPRIGAGQAGGSWPIIEEMIRERLCRADIDVYIYDLPVPEAKQEFQSLLFSSRD